jgi:hypothetical protein
MNQGTSVEEALQSAKAQVTEALKAAQGTPGSEQIQTFFNALRHKENTA